MEAWARSHMHMLITAFVLPKYLRTTRSGSVSFGIASLPRQFDLLNGQAPLAATFNSRLS